MLEMRNKCMKPASLYGALENMDVKAPDSSGKVENLSHAIHAIASMRHVYKHCVQLHLEVLYLLAYNNLYYYAKLIWKFFKLPHYSDGHFLLIRVASTLCDS